MSCKTSRVINGYAREPIGRGEVVCSECNAAVWRLSMENAWELCPDVDGYIFTHVYFENGDVEHAFLDQVILRCECAQPYALALSTGVVKQPTPENRPGGTFGYFKLVVTPLDKLPDH
jgi:hypothetical protein